MSVAACFCCWWHKRHKSCPAATGHSTGAALQHVIESTGEGLWICDSFACLKNASPASSEYTNYF
eukprot:6214754-Pleurochrysis_carterae.AAC.2